ncbi:MAG: MBL fold metallo-hydrolase [Chloroflexales bacterium]|nr:MBL fold metallo-hydrolase [Chloroflexales bacterium]
MEVVFLGGASGIGASCVAVQLGGRWLLVDAGVRVGGGDRLPDLAFLEGKNLAAIFITHAHADHIGALPLVHQTFPATPIYASRASMLLMEVMLNDALQVMAKRAISELEVPLYDKTLVARTLHRLRPLPLNGTSGAPELPGVTIHVARAGHVAGAVSLGFEARDGALLISGDVSLTPQRTVAPAAMPTLRQPDLLVLESTYGTRLHPNRRAEEDRLAQAVAAGIARGGHVLIPAFALGRAQEVLRILQSAQRRGSIPEFPIWVDGLVRTVCATYTAIPEALTPAMQRQIEAGHNPFTSRTIRFVDTPRQREQILQGALACIVSSSGMLTGGPSAFYATHLAENPEASILITGYQDEEAPGRRLLELAEGQGGSLDIGGKTAQVRCQIAKYALSAHADGSELAALVKALQPAAVALVHGDAEARAALAQRLHDTETILPNDGQALVIQPRARRTSSRRPSPNAVAGSGIGQGEPLGASDIPRLWAAVRSGGASAATQIVGIRELALVWYGLDAGADEELAVQQALSRRDPSDPDPYFVPLPDLNGMFRIRAPDEIEAAAAPQPSRTQIRPGMVLLVQAYPEKVVLALCYDTRSEAVWVYLPEGDINRNRYPRAAALDVLGPWPGGLTPDVASLRLALADHMKAAKQWRRRRPPCELAQQMTPEQHYSLDDLAGLMGIAPDNLVGRLALATMLRDLPRLFVCLGRDDSSLGSRYALEETWEEALAAGDGAERPDQMWILSVVERHVGNPPDLYKRSVNPDTGEVTLLFHFPAIAQARYGTALAAAAAEANVAITISPQAHQGALAATAQALLPSGLRLDRQPSLHLDLNVVRVKCSGTATQEATQQAIDQFFTQTGWHLEIEQRDSAAPAALVSESIPEGRMDEQSSVALVRSTLGRDSGCYKIGVNKMAGTLTVRFYFPAVAQERYAATLDALAERTGWRIMIHTAAHQGALEDQLRRVLPTELSLIGAPSLYQAERTLVATYRGSAAETALLQAQDAFSAATGWSLVLRREG